MRQFAQIAGRDAVSRKTGREETSRTGTTGTGRIAGSLRAAEARAGERKARVVRDIRIIKRVRLAAVLGIDLLIIVGAVLDRIAETRLPENEAGRVKALRWIHRQLQQKRDLRMKNAAEIRTETDDPGRI